ncbi:MAG: mechanosensitive ion channel [Cytophagales bacterium]|nr:mechanosensitive ion channel [Cytophagales bacterium]
MEFNLQKALRIVLDKLESWMETLIAMLPNLVVAVLILVIFYFLARLMRLVANRLLDRLSDKGAINNLFSTLFYLLTLGVGLIIALNVLRLEQTVTSLLAGAGIIGLALGFAFQDITANFISGILIAFRKPIQVGDIIQSRDFMGMVEKIDLRVTVIRTFQGLHVIIPNREIFQNPVTNYTKTYDRRIDLEVGVSYGEDLQRVKEITLNAMDGMPGLLPNKEVKLFYTGFGESSINFVLMLWIHYPDEPGYLEARSEAIMRVKKAFDANDITIPFPIRTLDFGIKGGKPISDMKLSLDNSKDS